MELKPLTVPGSLDSLAEIGDWVLEVAAAAHLDRTATYRLRLAVDEIATNVVTHGYGDARQDGEMHLSAVLGEEVLTLTLEDSAPAYDPTQAAEPDHLDQPLEEREIGGLGVYLALRGVDEFAYQRVGGRNRNIFVMKRRSPSADG